MQNVDLDWGNIGFLYRKTDYRYLAYWKDGQWEAGRLDEGNQVTISEGSTILHYGQGCFEGLKAQTAPDGRVLIFRPDQNAKRMNHSGQYILMPPIPEEMFVDACVQVVKANLRWVPPYGSGASLYIRPYMVGIGDNLGLKPAPEYLFSIFVCPVGPYFKAGFAPIHLTTTEYDRAAPIGTGAYKVGGNYAASAMPHKLAAEAGYTDCIYLDPKTHRYIDEVGTSNFFGITHDKTFVTPKSPSILPSITKYSLMHLAEHYLGLKVEERPVAIDQLDELAEAGACGTAAVITPIGSITHNASTHTFYADGKEAGPVTKQLYETLTAIQRGEQDAPEGWLLEVK
ncbi:branched-chain amino acid aminotransferase [candidate division KSB3 bacterium]|uniref:Branched-chain-amino-acid aminotransferase n=1 Tax=candidate division KSB3 bacterium TaxID=2044937 RepID=A0A9D5JS18_9BACT|nr:branched-chain amino acid aminotransferase [candidate division KSB3 bacterium]MBD3323195.1 branched-chain amino acid aminotransferase [candidate division KSB3 bacterium]